MATPRFPEPPFRRVYFAEDCVDNPYLANARRLLSGMPFEAVKDRDGIPPEHRNRDTVFFTNPRGRILTPCPGSRGHVCCNYLTLDLYLGCTLDCRYCIMKSYLNSAPLEVYGDPEPGLKAIRDLAAQYRTFGQLEGHGTSNRAFHERKDGIRRASRDAHDPPCPCSSGKGSEDAAPPRTQPILPLRVGTGEVGDSLLLDPWFGLSRRFIEGLADLPNVWFEMKTKTDHVDHLLDVPAKGNALIGFSLNPEAIAAEYETLAASPSERLAAARRAVEAGYSVAFHFDPVIRFDGWKEAYGGLIDRLADFAGTGGKRVVAWISLGTFRFTTGLRDRMDECPALYDEFVPCRDGKFRYLQSQRADMYSFMKERIARVLDAPVYLCMESAAVWRRVFGRTPGRPSTPLGDRPLARCGVRGPEDRFLFRRSASGFSGDGAV